MFSKKTAIFGVVFLGVLLLLTTSLWVATDSVNAQSITSASNTTDDSVDQTDVVFVLHADSLLKIFEEILGPTFENQTEYLYQGESGGSEQLSKMILDGQRKPDVFVSAGSNPIIRLMNFTPSLSDWLVKFGSAEIVIAYSPNSTFFNELEKARNGEIPWYKVLASEGFKFGRTNPELDPKGYYMIISADLANTFYNDSTIRQRILGDDMNPEQIFPGEILKTSLQQGQLDAIAAYKHEAVSSALPYITLPVEINLGDPEYSELYKMSSYTLGNGSETIFGQPIYFSFTIPNTAKNLDGAISFTKFILSTNGTAILKDNGLDDIQPIIEGKIENVPAELTDVMRGSRSE